MADFLGKVFKAASVVSSSTADDDFADFATPSPATPDPVAPSHASDSIAPPGDPTGRPWIKAKEFAFDGPWYAIWERHSLSEFRTEGFIVLIILVTVAVQIWGSRRNRALARGFIASISGVLAKEFAMVGFSETPRPNTLPSGNAGEKVVTIDPAAAVKENSNIEFISYATGRSNIMYLHSTINLIRRNNPIAAFGELFASFFFESFTTPEDVVTMTISPFDGKTFTGEKSTYDNFVWALVNKRGMRKWRESRYDMSLTRTSDWEGMPNWAAVMGESKEIGDLVLNKELKDAVIDAGEFFDFVIVTDQPKEKPLSLAECIPHKRITMQFRLPSLNSPTDVTKLNNLVSAFIHLTDHLVEKAHFRTEVQRKIKATRDDAEKKLRKMVEEEEAEKREQKRAEDKKKERDARLGKMTAAEQKKFLEKEREKDQRRRAGKQVKRA